MLTRKEIGNRAEEAVTKVFLDHGYTLVARNFEVHNFGELDIVFTKNRTLYVVEVKARLENTLYEEPIDAITKSKIRKMEKTTQILVRKLKLYDYNICYFAGLVTHNRAGIIQKIKIVPFE